MTQATARQTEHPVDSLFVDRWSTRAYTGEAIPRDVLFSAFEALRWAPSGGNSQPWRVIYVLPGTSDWSRLFSTLAERNQLWAKNAGALVLLLSNKFRKKAGTQESEPYKFHSFDTGAAWSNFALQLVKSGWATRAIGGFDRAKARAEFSVPDAWELEVVVAVGRPAAASVLPSDLAEQDKPNGRLPVSEIVSEGTFAFA